MEKIEIVSINRLSTPGNLKAFVDVKIGEIGIKDFRIIQQPDQRPWVSVPQRSYKDKEGNSRFAPLIDIPFSLKNEIERVVLDAYTK